MVSEQTPAERRTAARPTPPRTRRRPGLHLQRADDRPSPAGPLPGRCDQPPPPPHPASLQRRGERRRRLPALDPVHAAARSRPSPASSALVVLIAGPGADADRLRRQVQLRPRRRSCWSPSGMGFYLSLRHPQPGGAGAGPGAARGDLLGRPPRSPSWSGTCCRSWTSSAGSRSASPRRRPARRAAVPALPQPPRAPGGRRPPGLAGGDRGAARGRRRGRLRAAPWASPTAS